MPAESAADDEIGRLFAVNARREFRKRPLSRRVQPADARQPHLPAVRVSGAHREAARNGMPLRAQWLDAPAPEAQAVRVYVGDSFAGVGAPQEDGSVRFRAMLLK